MATDEKKLSEVAFKTFLNIMKLWDVSTADQRILLGGMSSSTYHKYKNELKKNNQLNTIFSKDLLDRISYIIGIYRALQILFSGDKNFANAWIKKPNKATLFAGKSALDIMLQGDIMALHKVRAYLDGELGGWYEETGEQC